jgi:hypothetical protein
MTDPKPRKENYPLAIFLFFILFLIAAGWLLIPGLQSAFEESSQISSLQNRGTFASGCITAKDAHEGWRGLPELIYQIQTSNGIFDGRIKVTEAVFEQYQVGNCIDIVYLPENPGVNSARSYVEAWDFQEYWSSRLSFVPIILASILLMIVFAILNFFRRRSRLQLK